jgi:hypothetical protein
MERRNDGGGGSGGKIKIGVCVMQKKVSGWAFGETNGFLAEFLSSWWLRFLSLFQFFH